ncbi:MAG: hypothetical protein ISS66_17735 [Desulfobacteraceae bacterium]|nr:hypothetical protein [Desulfobacteraceae bacterium]
MTSFLSDWWPATSPSALSSGPKGSAESEAFVISGCYEMGDPLAPSEVEGNREGGGLPACPAPKRGS